MTTNDGADDPIRAAWQELQQTLANARTALDRVRAQPVHTADERRELQQDAASGALGRDMQRLAEHVEAGRTSWGDVFEGTSEYSDLLTTHLDRMVEENQEMLKRAIEEDDGFDPMAPSPEV
jgi:hypothetical protein